MSFDQKDNLLSAVGHGRNLQTHGLTVWTLDKMDIEDDGLWCCWCNVERKAAMFVTVEKVTPLFLILRKIKSFL